MFFAFDNKEIAAEIKGTSPWHIADQANAVLLRGAIDVAWDTDTRRLPFVKEHLSVDAGN